MSLIEAEVVKREGFKPTERIGDGELANLISAVGNSEAKSITLFSIRNGEPYERKDLKTAVTKLQGGMGKGWDIDSGNLYSYYSWRMTDVGLVDPDDGPPRTYAITQYGQEKGIPLAGLLLDFSLRHPETSLYKLFGPPHTGSPEGKRGPLTSLRIFRVLAGLGDEPVRKEDIMDRLEGENNHHLVKYHLRRLDKDMIIRYTAASHVGPIVHAKIKGDCPKETVPYKKNRTLGINVIAALRRFQESNPREFITIRGIVGLLSSREVGVVRDIRRESTVSHILSFYMKQGYIEKIGGPNEYSNHSRTSLTVPPEMKQMIRELLSIIDRFKQLDPEIIKRGNRMAGFFGSHPAEVAALIEKAREASDHAK